MGGPRKRGRRAASVIFGLLLIGATVIWSLFWALIAAWVATDDSSDMAGWLFLAGMFAIGIIASFVGIFLVSGWFPKRWGWVAVVAIAALPVVPAVVEGLASEEHVASVTAAAQQAYASERGGPIDATADCTWELDDPETWRCSVAGDVCFVEITEESVHTVGRIDHCDGDDAQVARAVERVYRAQRGRSAEIAYCFGEAGLWRCALRRAPDRYCFVEAAWQAGGRLETQVAVCERELLRSVTDAYRQRKGRQGVATACVEDEQNRGIWSCRVRSAAVRDTCIVTFDSPGSNASATVGYCERELADAVERLFAHVYVKRTDARDATAECRLVEDGEWTCSVTYGSGRRDRCEVAIERRDAGPKVVFWATSCTSGRL